MSGPESNRMEHYTPQHPLPEPIKQMDRDETICRYCGVSYLIHNEIKALENKLKALEKELETLRGSEEREARLQEEVTRLQEKRGEYEMTVTVKDAAISSLTNAMKTQEEQVERLRSQKEEAESQLSESEKTTKQLKERNNAYEHALPAIKFTLRQQKLALDDIHTFLEVRDKQTKEEVAALLSHVQSSCDLASREKEELLQTVSELRARETEVSSLSAGMKEEFERKFHEQESQLQQVSALQTESRQLQEHCTGLQSQLTSVKVELEEAVKKSRSFQMECQQFKEQLQVKTQEFEEQATTHRRKEQGYEMTMQKLQGDLKKKELDLLGAKKELKDLQNKFYEQQQMEEDLSRKASRTINESKDLKEQFFKAKEEVENLKHEREVMITSHQNRIEQLRESFKEKIFEAELWPEKLEAAIQKEKERHAAELRALEDKLKENFVMELEIEKGKYQELMKKYQFGSKETEEKLRAQLMSVEARYQQEIAELNRLLVENRKRAKEMEEELRREIESLKAIIRDLEARLGKLDYGNEELVVKLRTQLQETHSELEEAREELDKRKLESTNYQEEVKFLQETVRKECEERLELTEALGEAKEELLHLKKPADTSSTSEAGGYHSITPRQPTNLSLPTPSSEENGSSSQIRKSSSVPAQMSAPRPPSSSSRNHVYAGGPRREYTLTASNTMVFNQDTAMSQRSAGGKSKAGTLAENRRRIAAILGRKS